MTVKEDIFCKIEALFSLKKDEKEFANKIIQDILSLICSEALLNHKELFGNLFSQVDYLCKVHNIAIKDVIAIQRMRAETRVSRLFSQKELASHIRALAVFASSVFEMKIPSSLNALIPGTYYITKSKTQIDYRKIRAIVRSINQDYIIVQCNDIEQLNNIKVNINEPHLIYLRDILTEGMQVNLLDCSVDNNTINARLIVVEPDFLLDISSIARCFTDCGHHPLSYTYNRLTPAANSLAILLGNFSGVALDDIINAKDNYNWHNSLKKSFSAKTLEYCACNELTVPNTFKSDAQQQTHNIKQIVDELFNSKEQSFDKSKAILEPSFVCEELGIQGRVDLMTTDFKLLVEQKSGSNFNIARNIKNKYGSFQKEDHYVQLLLYYGVLNHNFKLRSNKTNIRLLYSKYPLPGGLVVVGYYQKLFREAIEFRNKVVATELYIAQHSFNDVLPMLTDKTLNQNNINSSFYFTYIQPQYAKVLNPLQKLSDLEKAYFCRMLTFVYREQASSKISANEGHGVCDADLWNMPLAQKREAGNIYTELTITNKKYNNDKSAVEELEFKLEHNDDNFLPNFRKGDKVCLYSYLKTKEPIATEAILYKGTLVEVEDTRLALHLNDAQQNNEIFDTNNNNDFYFAIEHVGTDSGFTATIRSLHEFITAPQQKKNLILGLAEPRVDKTLTLSRSYHSTYDEVLLKIKQSLDYFLLIGPPGTGKTSMALRFIVEEELTNENSSILLLSYTNRAVDEICEMLCNANISFIRMGNSYAADPRFAPYFIETTLNENPKLNQLKAQIQGARVVVTTTATLQNKGYLFALKHFTLAVVDESSQIVESAIVGLLAAHSSTPNKSIAIDKFVLIGDHKQLPAVVRQQKDVSKVYDKQLNDIGIVDCRESLFERLLREARLKNRDSVVGTLHKQGRMHPEIANFASKMFYAREQLDVVPLEHQEEDHLDYENSSIDTLDDMLKKHRLMFFPSPTNISLTQSDKVNAFEARLVALLCVRIYRQYINNFNSQKTLGIIIPYRNQIAMIRKEIEKTGISQLKNISIDTVERYQGSQREVIIYSFTVQHSYQINFLTSNTFVEDGHVIDRKLNVALTRARRQMLITGNQEILKTNNVFKELISYIKSKGGYYKQNV